MEEIRLNKFISDSGFCSRREADRYIECGSVRVNGRIAEMGLKVTAKDEVKVNGSIIEATQGMQRVYIALNKPVGIVSTTDPSERDNIVDFVNYPARIFNIGRLDKPSEGLILLTNDGDIVNKILRASNNHDKEYEVVVNRPITAEFLKKMASGVPILGTVTKKCKITQEGANSFRIILTQGLNRQIRRMCECLGYEVVKLKRTRIMNISLGKLPIGHWRLLNDNEIAILNKSLEESDGSEAASVGAGAGKCVSPKFTSKSTSKPTSKSTPKSTPKSAFKSTSNKSMPKFKPNAKSATKRSDDKHPRSSSNTSQSRSKRGNGGGRGRSNNR